MMLYKRIFTGAWSTTKAQVGIKELPIKHQGRPLLLQEGSDQSVQEYTKSLSLLSFIHNDIVK